MPIQKVTAAIDLVAVFLYIRNYTLKKEAYLSLQSLIVLQGFFIFDFYLFRATLFAPTL